MSWLQPKGLDQSLVASDVREAPTLIGQVRKPTLIELRDPFVEIRVGVGLVVGGNGSARRAVGERGWWTGDLTRVDGGYLVGWERR